MTGFDNRETSGTLTDQANTSLAHAFKQHSFFYFVGGSVNPGGVMSMLTLSRQRFKTKIIENFKKKLKIVEKGIQELI